MAESPMKTYRIQGLSCTNCAAKFENNVRELEGVKDAKINFGASKISVQGSATIEQIEKAGAFDNLKIRGEQEQATQKNHFGSKKKILKWCFRLSYCWSAGYWIIDMLMEASCR